MLPVEVACGSGRWNYGFARLDCKFL